MRKLRLRNVSFLLRSIQIAEKPTFFLKHLHPASMAPPLLFSHILDSPTLKLTNLSSQEVFLQELKRQGVKGSLKAKFIPGAGTREKGT